MFSRRLPQDVLANELTRRLRELRLAGVDIDDLTESNPTRVGFSHPPRLLDPLSSAASMRYEPEPLGLLAAREAVAGDHRRRHAYPAAADIVLTASTSEAYSWLFKLLCNPGDHVLVPAPSYPLFEHLTMIEGVRSATYQLEYHRRWEIDFSSIEAAPAGTRAVVVVSPNNPTGSYTTRTEFDRLTMMCRERGWAVIADEVFADYPLDLDEPFTDWAARNPSCLTFTLGGFSKMLGLPQLKLGWIVAGGPEDLRKAAVERLEFVADTFLSVGTPVQVAAASLLDSGAAMRQAIHTRVSENLASLRTLVAPYPSVDLLRAEGGWSAVIRVPATYSEDELVLRVLESERILVYPGYFFDFERGSHLVVSLLTRPERFAAAIARLLRVVS